MNATEFIQNFEAQLEGHDGSEITLETKFRELECWDSLTGAAVQIMIHDSYQASIPDEDFRNAKTLGDLINLTIKNIVA